MRAFALAALAAVVAVASLTAAGQPARANGVPQIVKLSYLDGVSNWGPKDAEGVLELSFAEAFARLEVKNLTPAEGVTYEGWLIAPDGAARLVGFVNPQPSGSGAIEAKLDGLARYDYNLFVIAARPAGAQGDAVPAQKSIAGRFTLNADAATGQTPGNVRPALLPETGEKAAPAGLPWGRVFTTVLVAGGTAVMLAAFRRRRHRQGGHA